MKRLWCHLCGLEYIMAEMIGLTNNVTLEWMELAANCKLLGKDMNEAKSILDENISLTIKSKDNIRKKRDIVLNMWYRPEDWFLAASLKAAQNLLPDERIGIHWALLMKRYKVFYDLCYIIGGLFDYRDEITLAQIRNRIFEKWGARNTLQNSLSKNIQTFRELKSIQATESSGTYKKGSLVVDDPHVMQLLCAAVVESSGREYMTWEEIVHYPVLFPFNIRNMTQADMAACDKLMLERMGDDVVIRVTE